MESFVLVTSPAGARFATDVVSTPVTETQRLSDTPVALANPAWAYAWAAATAWEHFQADGAHRAVWLIMGGVVTDHYSTNKR